ncbi:meiosis 1 arrest [Labeo rohita]|uniref:Meiosis 1 arrest n=1 Tax=Labeo rohita TaxID=84645 RepID=A0A498NV53_LABRO|nr:meiosis 1 arrest [Labeo rohita]
MAKLHCFEMKCPQAFQSLDFRFANFGNNVTSGIEASACFPLSPMNRRGSFTLIPAYNEEVMCLHVSVLISQHSLQLKPLKASVKDECQKQILLILHSSSMQFIILYQTAFSCVDSRCFATLVQVKGNLARLLSCIEELRSLPPEGCIRQRGALLKQAVLDSLQQFKQYMCHTAHGEFNSNSVEVTVLTCQSGQTVLRQLEQGLKNSDLISLRRLLVVHITLQQSLSDRSPACSLETPSLEDDQEENLMLGTEVDVQLVEGTVVALENFLKMWLHDQGGDREHLHLLLPPSLTSQGSTPHPANNRPSPVCLKCDMQERLLSPALLPSTPDLGMKTERMQDFQPPNKSLANQNPSPQRLQAVKYSHTRDWFLLVRSESGSGSRSGVFSHYILQSSGSLSLLLKPVLTRELMLPCCLPVSMEDPPLPALASVESSLDQLEKDPVFNPLCLDSNLYLHLSIRGSHTRSSQPFGAQGQGHSQRRGASRPPEGSTQRQGRQSQSRVRATVAPLPSIPLNKMPRTLTFSHSRPCAPALFFQNSYEEEDTLIIQ